MKYKELRRVVFFISLVLLFSSARADMYMFSGEISQTTGGTWFPIGGTLQVSIGTSIAPPSSGHYTLLVDDISTIEVFIPAFLDPLLAFTPIAAAGELQDGQLTAFSYTDGIPLDQPPTSRTISEFHFTQNGDWFFDVIFPRGPQNPGLGGVCPPRGSGYSCTAFSYINAEDTTSTVNTVPLPGALWFLGSGLLGLVGLGFRHRKLAT